MQSGAQMGHTLRSQHLPSRLASVVTGEPVAHQSGMSTPVDGVWSLPGAGAIRTQFESAVVQH